MGKLASMFAAQNATSTSAWIVIFTSMRACTIALVVRVNAVSHHCEAVARIIRVLYLIFSCQLLSFLDALKSVAELFDDKTVYRYNARRPFVDISC